MSLNNGEKSLLKLYLEFFDKEYNVNDDSTLNGLGMPKRYVRMQNLVLFCDCSGINIGDYGFSWNVCPYSPGLQLSLMELDEKTNLIEEFYKEYNSKRDKHFSSYQMQLREILGCREEQADYLALSSYILKDIWKSEYGSILVASIIYYYTTIYPNESPEVIFLDLSRKLRGAGIEADWDILYKIWKELSVLGIIKIQPKVYIPEEKSLSIQPNRKISGKK